MEKAKWIAAAAKKLQPYLGEHANDYAESLHKTYVEEGQDYEDDPDGAVDEDMHYWNS